MKSLIEHNKLGVLCSYRSRDIAASIAQMLRTPSEEYKAMSKRCIDISESRFNWESLEPALFDLLSRIE